MADISPKIYLHVTQLFARYKFLPPKYIFEPKGYIFEPKRYIFQKKRYKLEINFSYFWKCPQVYVILCAFSKTWKVGHFRVFSSEHVFLCLCVRPRLKRGHHQMHVPVSVGLEKLTFKLHISQKNDQTIFKGFGVWHHFTFEARKASQLGTLRKFIWKFGFVPRNACAGPGSGRYAVLESWAVFWGWNYDKGFCSTLWKLWGRKEIRLRKLCAEWEEKLHWLLGTCGGLMPFFWLTEICLQICVANGKKSWLRQPDRYGHMPLVMSPFRIRPHAEPKKVKKRVRMYILRITYRYISKMEIYSRYISKMEI